MANYYMQDGRYFGEDTSFYEFDKDCLKRSEQKPDFGEGCPNRGKKNPNPDEDCQNRSEMNPNPDEDCPNRSKKNPNSGEDCLQKEEIRPDFDDDRLKLAKSRPDFDDNCPKSEENEPDFDCGACSPDANSSENQPDPPADFDRLFTTRSLDMLKTAIPFLPTRQQKTFACAVKLVEFRNLVGYFSQNQPALLGACSAEDPQMRLADMLNALRVYCSPAEQEQINSLFQVLMTVQMMRESM